MKWFFIKYALIDPEDADDYNRLNISEPIQLFSQINNCRFDEVAWDIISQTDTEMKLRIGLKSDLDKPAAEAQGKWKD